MSEVENEVEMTADEVRRDAIRTMMTQWKDGKLTDAQDTFNSILGQKADDLVDARKADIASAIYNKPEGEIVDDGDLPFDAEDYMEPESEEEPTEAPEETVEEPEEAEADEEL